MLDFANDGFRTSVQVIAEHAQRTPDKTAIRQKRYGVWNEITWKRLDEIVKELAAGMIELGLKPGDKIGILSENRQEWVLTQFAAQSATNETRSPTARYPAIGHWVASSK